MEMYRRDIERRNIEETFSGGKKVRRRQTANKDQKLERGKEEEKMKCEGDGNVRT